MASINKQHGNPFKIEHIWALGDPKNGGKVHKVLPQTIMLASEFSYFDSQKLRCSL